MPGSPSSPPRQSPRRRPNDLESQSPYSTPSAGQTPSRNHRRDHSYGQPGVSPGAYEEHNRLMANQPEGLLRKKSLIRQDRRPNDPNSRDYHYRKHAAGMAVYPSTTGNDPMQDDEVHTVSSEGTEAKNLSSREYSRRQHRLAEADSPPSQEKSSRSKD